MAFVKIDKKHRSSSGSVNEIRMGSQLRSDTAPRGLYISISQDIIEATKWPVEAAGKRIRLAIDIGEGTGDDAGFLMLTHGIGNTATVFGAEAGSASSYVATIAIARLKHYVLNDLAASPETVEFSIEGDSILIQCPDWLRFNPQSMPEEPKPEATVHNIKLNRAARVARRLK